MVDHALPGRHVLPRGPRHRHARRRAASHVVMLAVLCFLLPAGAATLAIPPTEAAASTARPDDSVLLPFTGWAEMALDDAHGHLFFFGYAPGDEIIVTDLAGKVLTRIRPG